MFSFLFWTATCLFWAGVYFTTGYFTFRVWTSRTGIQNGTFGNDWGDSFKTHIGWFVPSWVDTSSKRGITRGQSVQATFWQSTLMWPLVWLLVFVVKVIGGLDIMARSICKSVCESATEHVLPPPPTIEEEYMIEGNREVEKLLTEEK